MTRWRKNEPTASKRRVTIFLYDIDGQPIEPLVPIVFGTDLLVDKGDGAYTTPLGTLTPTTRPLVVADDVVESVNTTLPSSLVQTAHGLQDCDGPFQWTTTNTLPAGMSLLTDYWLTNVTDDTFELATSLANAMAGNSIGISTSGTGTHTMHDTASTRRVNRGSYLYEATQAEINYDGSYFALRFAKTNYKDMIEPVELYVREIDELIEGSYSVADILRLIASMNAGPVQNFQTGTLAFKSLDGSKTRNTVTTNATGRTAVVPGDLT